VAADLSTQKGKLAEQEACNFLVLKGFKILEKNFYAKKLGEIDIIAKKDDIYHFCEVKSAQEYEQAVNNLTKTKLFKIKQATLFYLQQNKLNVSFCIDALIVVNKEITFLENITL